MYSQNYHMKVYFISFFVVSYLTLSRDANAQLNFGVKGGLSVASARFDSDRDIDTDYTLKFNAGVLAQIPLGEKFYLQPELMYSQGDTKHLDVYFWKKRP